MKSDNRKMLITSAIVLLLGLSTAFAEIPRTIGYQGVLTDASGNPKADGNYSMIATNGSATTKVYFDTNGHVGIGTLIPGDYKLYVNGTTYCSAGAWAGSDRRFKTTILPLDSSLTKVTSLQGVSYDWNRAAFPSRNFPEGRQIGLIAQDVEKVIPEVVHTDAEGYKSLSYDKLTAVLIEAVKEQQNTIQKLEKRIEVLESSQKMQ